MLPSWVTKICDEGVKRDADVFVSNPKDRIVFVSDTFKKVRPFIDFESRPTFDECYRREVDAGIFYPERSIDEDLLLLKKIKTSPFLTYPKIYKESTSTCVHHNRDGWIVRTSKANDRLVEHGVDQTMLWSTSILDSLAIPIASVTGDGTLVYINVAMVYLFGAQQGIFISNLGHLAVDDKSANHALGVAIAWAARTPGSPPRPLIIPVRGAEVPYLLTVRHLPPKQALIQIAPPSVDSNALAYLLAETGLTAAQSRVASQIGCEDTTATGTRRNHIKAILRVFRSFGLPAKTQQDIVSTVSSLRSIAGIFRQNRR